MANPVRTGEEWPKAKRWPVGCLLVLVGICLGYYGVSDMEVLAVPPAACFVAAGIGMCTRHWAQFMPLIWLGVGSATMLNGLSKPNWIRIIVGGLICLIVFAQAALAAGEWMRKQRSKHEN